MDAARVPFGLTKTSSKNQQRSMCFFVLRPFLGGNFFFSEGRKDFVPEVCVWILGVLPKQKPSEPIDASGEMRNSLILWPFVLKKIPDMSVFMQHVYIEKNITKKH